MHLGRSQKKFQQIFPKNGRVITVQNDLVNEKKTQFCNFKAVELKNYTKSTWKIDKLKRKCMGNSLLVVWGLYKGAPGNTPKKKAKNGLFWLFFEKLSCLKRPNPSKFVWAILLDVRD